MEYLINHIVFIVIVTFLTGMMLLGHKRGFFRTSQHLIALAASILLMRFLYPHMLVWLGNSSVIGRITDKLKSALISRAPDSRADMLAEFFGINTLSANIGDTLKQLVIKVIGFILLYIAVILLVKLVVALLDRTAQLPVISGLNQIAGALLGTAIAVVYVWIFMMIVSVFSYQEWGQFVLGQIRASRFLNFIYQNNMLLQFLKGLLQSIL